MHWKKLSSKYLSKHVYFTARKDRCEMPDGTIVPEYFVVEMPDSTCAMALTENNEVILVKQYRHPIETNILELPGGFVDKDETAETAIARELQEETGYRFTDFYYLGKTAANPGVLNNFTHLYLATGGKKVTEQKLDFNEEIEIQLYPLEEARTLLLNNEITQSMHALCMFYGFAKLGELRKL
jgi:8-oxo-dGTP pyrophosphatase MutT (NUDIX family)